VSIPVITVHDHGCRYAREDNGGHSDAAKRLSDTYQLHRLMGHTSGWIAVRLADADSDHTVYETREAAVNHQHHNERWFAFVELIAPSMTVCEAASVLAWQRQAANLVPAQRGEAGGGLVVIPRLGLEEIDRQSLALAGGLALPVALGRKV